MLLLQLTLLFVLGDGGSSEFIDLYHRAGDEVLLPCNSVDSSESSCSRIGWHYYYRGSSNSLDIVRNGKINKDSPKAAKVSLDRRCSLTITNVSSEDAGLYLCRYGGTNAQDTSVYLNILTLTADQRTDPEGGVTLTCTLWRFKDTGCVEGGLRWLDEARAELKQGNDEGYHLNRQMNCVSHLTITHQRNHNTQYTCQCVIDDEVKTFANYTLVSTVGLTDSTPNDITFTIIIGAAVGLLTILLFIVLIVFIKSRRKTGAADAPKPAQVPDEPETDPDIHQPVQLASLMDEAESSVTYVTVNYRNRNQEASPSSEVAAPEQEEEVTYATVKK